MPDPLDVPGLIIQRICYDDYGCPLIRESCGRGDLNQDSKMNGTDDTRFALAKNTCSSSCIWDPRADLDDDGDVDSTDQSLYDTKRTTWNVTTCDGTGPTVAQAFSDVDNPYLFQGVPHFALDTNANDTSGKLMLNHHRTRYNNPVAGEWVSRDSKFYMMSLRQLDASTSRLNIFQSLGNNPVRLRDAMGQDVPVCPTCPPPTGRCCRAGGACSIVSMDECYALQGTPGGAGSVCLGDNNGDGWDDACGNVPCQRNLVTIGFHCYNVERRAGWFWWTFGRHCDIDCQDTDPVTCTTRFRTGGGTGPDGTNGPLGNGHPGWKAQSTYTGIEPNYNIDGVYSQLPATTCDCIFTRGDRLNRVPGKLYKWYTSNSNSVATHLVGCCLNNTASSLPSGMMPTNAQGVPYHGMNDYVMIQSSCGSALPEDPLYCSRTDF